MKKYLLLLILLMVTGCSVVRIDTSSIDNIVDVVLSKNNKLYNEEGHGYSYYIPRGVSHIESDEQKETLYCNGDYYYLYIDTVGYYYSTKVKFEKDTDAYYYKIIKNNNGRGYLKIKEEKGMYYVEFDYNYAHIEAMVTKENLNTTILNSSYILSTVKFNKKIISLMLDEEYFTNKTGKYDLFNDNGKSTKFKFEIEKEG